MNNTPTPRTETDLFEATKVSLRYGNQRLFKKSQSTRIVAEVAFSDGYEYALKHSFKIKQLERELAAVTDQLKAAQNGWHDEITKGLTELRRAESIYTKAQERAERAEEQRDEYKAALQSADNHNHEIATKLEIVTEQRDRLAEALEQWQPIETAPKDRSFILSAHPEHGYLITRWLGAREMWDGWAIEPTHWMSLPKQPTP